MDESLIEKTDIFYLDIPYLLNINMYSLKAFSNAMLTEVSIALPSSFPLYGIC